MSLNLILATDINNGIARDGCLAWKDQEEMNHFKSLTMGNVVIMGYRTWVNDLHCKPLIGRENVVIIEPFRTVLQPQPFNEATTSVRYMVKEQVDEYIEELIDNNAVFVIGGKNTYERYLSLATDIYWSKGNFDAECDVHYDPDLDEEHWEEHDVIVINDNFTCHHYKRK